MIGVAYTNTRGQAPAMELIMTKQFKLIVALTVCIGMSSLVSAQCTDLPQPADGKAKVLRVNKTSAEAEKEYSHVLAVLDRDVRFKVTLSHDMTGGFTKTNDFVLFKTLENVYGVGQIDTQNSAGHSITIFKRCVLIPKDTSIYGLVDHANSRYPFSIGGKGKLFIMVNSLKLDNGIDNEGVLVKLRFSEPRLPSQRPENPNEHQGLTRACKHAQTTCIVGRRAKLKISPGAIGAGAATGLLLVKNGDDDDGQDAIGAIAALSFLESLSKASGIDDLVNPPDALLKKDMIFEIETGDVTPTNPIRLFVPLTKAEPRTPEKPSPDKPKDN